MNTTTPFQISSRLFVTLLAFALSIAGTPAQALTDPADSISSHVFQAHEIQILADNDYFPALRKQIRAARKSIHICMFLFKATNHSNNGPRIVVDELIKAAARGVEVTVVLEKSGYDEGLNEKNTGAAERLRRHQIRVLYDSPARTNHVKAVIIDATYTFVGSHNFTYSAFSRNHELSLLVRDREMAARLIAYIEGIADAP